MSRAIPLFRRTGICAKIYDLQILVCEFEISGMHLTFRKITFRSQTFPL